MGQIFLLAQILTMERYVDVDEILYILCVVRWKGAETNQIFTKFIIFLKCGVHEYRILLRCSFD